jgi:FkbM family methyltransferase
MYGKKFIKEILARLGVTVSIKPRRSKRTSRLSFYKTATGNYYLPTDARSDQIANVIKNDQIFDEPIYKIARQFIKPGSAVLDVGSNFGQMAILFSRLAEENGVVHAFEADDFIYSILEKNCLENSDSIITHFGAVHNRSGETLHFPVQDFESFGTYGSYGIDYIKGHGRPVRTLTIDDLEIERPISFMKIDVQGGDLLAMEGSRNTIRKHRMPIIFEYEYLFEDDLNLCFQDYVDFVRSIDYHFEKVILGQNFLILPNQP